MNWYTVWRRYTVLSFLLLFAVGCHVPQSNVWSRTGVLRGPVIVYIAIPIVIILHGIGLLRVPRERIVPPKILLANSDQWGNT